MGTTRCSVCALADRNRRRQARTKAGDRLNELRKQLLAEQQREAEAATVAAILDHPLDGLLGTGTLTERLKRFRELALWVHPDKCVHPRAADAFKHLQAAKDLIQSQK